jgi:hypothetical protein
MPEGLIGVLGYELTVRQASRSETFQGPIDKDYLKTDIFGVESTVWSACGAEDMLNINSAVQVSPLGSQEVALLTVSTGYLCWRG